MIGTLGFISQGAAQVACCEDGGPLGARPGEFAINSGCPSIGDPALATLTMNELNERCFGSGSRHADVQPLSCGQIRGLALTARNNADYVEGQAVGRTEALCEGQLNAQYPTNVPAAPQPIPTGIYVFERGYSAVFPEPKRSVCRPLYVGEATVADDGTITFLSGGHSWEGVVGTDLQIRLTRDGVTHPRPQNDTGIFGSIYDARLYNGYCGEGFFRLGKKLL
jgi:hypothetical protein